MSSTWTTNRLTRAIVDLNDFEIESKPFASGQYGTVYKGVQLSTGLKVAVKRQYPEYEADAFDNQVKVSPEDLYRAVVAFFREIFVQLTASHAAVVPLVGWTIRTVNGKVEFVVITELMKDDLESKDDRVHHFTPTQKTILLYGIARGMAHLHSLRILHRDLKTANVFIDEKVRPRIADLGLAKVVTTDQQSIQCGTPVYLAPEVWNSQTYSFPADVYSYAMITYELLEERFPLVEGINSVEQLKGHATSGRRPTISYKLSKAHREMLKRLWHTQPSKRPKFQRIAQKLEKSKYWVKGTDPAAFAEYKAWIDAESIRQARPTDGDDSITLIPKKLEISDQTIQSILGDCELGNFRAQTAAALLYLTGNVGPINLYEAATRLVDSPDTCYISVFKKCLRQGSAFEKGAVAEIEGRYEEAVRFYKEAALNGNKEAILRYGSLLLSYGSEADGLAILNLVADAGDLRALYTLGDYYFRIKQDNSTALSYFQRSCDPKINKDFYEPYYITAVIAEKVKNGHLALSSATAALDLSPPDVIRMSLLDIKRRVERTLQSAK